MREDRECRLEIGEAKDDLEKRTLAALPTELAKLIYLASTRDYSTGRYYHDGLAFQFSGKVAEAALSTLHREVFERLVFLPLGGLLRELKTFFRAAAADPEEVRRVWNKIQPYRVVIPMDCDPVRSEFFFSNVRIALTILEDRPASLPHR
ncbi:MAG: hypothetical protein HY648_06040 [Acidobacteria bacterium]|nr:hypothetical protein [Acidobacteriota bacterium]